MKVPLPSKDLYWTIAESTLDIYNLLSVVLPYVFVISVKLEIILNLFKAEYILLLFLSLFVNCFSSVSLVITVFVFANILFYLLL